ncbi:MAG TPA: DUF6569 family protein [Myxococcales bacterium]|jgi:hypothetical protein
MRQALMTLAAAVVLAVSPAARAQKAGFDPDAMDVGEPVIAHNIAVVPLFTKKAPPYDEYVVLEEAQTAKSVKVSETKGEEVDKLVVRNRDTDKRPLYLLGGEVVLGGKQDRMVVNDTVVDPAATKVLEVRCVEQGRWQGADLTFHSSEAVAHPDLRKAALFKGQGDVWNEVARKSGASQVSSATGTYRRVLQDKAVRERIKSYLDELQSRIPKSEKLIGLAVAINGNLELVDVFDSPRLYAKLERKLLASYVLAALERQPGSVAKARAYEAKARKLGKAHVDTLIRGTGSGSADGSGTPDDGRAVGIGGLGTRGGGTGELAAKPATSAQQPSKPTQAKTGPSKVFFDKGKAVHGTYFSSETAKDDE